MRALILSTLILFGLSASAQIDTVHYLQVSNGYKRPVIDSIKATPIGMESIMPTITSNYTATVLDRVLPVDASSGPVTITLPTGSSIYYQNRFGKYIGKAYYIKKMDSSSNGITIVGIIDGTSNFVIIVPMHTLHIVANSTTTYIRR